MAKRTVAELVPTGDVTIVVVVVVDGLVGSMIIVVMITVGGVVVQYDWFVWALGGHDDIE